MAVSCVALYQPVINYLSEQAANPKGFIGSIMTKIWSNYFVDLNRWGYSHINLDEMDVILDIGFGGGGGIKYVNEHNKQNIIYGIDISEEAVKIATSENQKYINDGKVILSVGDVACLEFESEFFNLVVAVQTHIYWDELEKGLSECYRVLIDDGTFLVICEMDKIEYHLAEYQNQNDFKSLLYKIGFREVDVKINHNYIAFICKK